MNIYLHELRSFRKGAFIWTCSMIALGAMFLLIFPSMTKDAADFKELLGAYPASVRAMLGINLEYITSILGFYSMVYAFIALCGAIQAMNLGTSILSKESRERTADFLLVKPVSRSKIVSAKLLAACTVIIVTDLVFYVVTFMIANSVATADYNRQVFLMINVTLLFIQLIFLAVGLVVSVFFTRLKNVLPISLGVVFGLYMIGALFASGVEAQAARYLSPFKYFDSFYIIQHASYELPYLLVGAVIIVAAVAVSYRVYIKKDIHAV